MLTEMLQAGSPNLDAVLPTQLSRGVVFAPDYRKDNPYQQLLADALKGLGIEVNFLSEYRRGLPLSRGGQAFPKATLHLHWPEAYFSGVSAQQSRVRKVRFPFDLLLARALHPLVITAHNLKPHWTAGRVHPLFAYSFRLAGRVIAHSQACKELLVREVRLTPERVVVIPHGDLLDALPTLPQRNNARSELSLQPTEKYALVFGRLSRYKGVEEMIAFWTKAKPNTVLAVVGEGDNPTYAEHLEKMVRKSSAKIILRASKLADHELSCWLSAADCALFNYSNVFTSGAANLARSAGIPILLPNRLSTVDLEEPCSSVFRFDRLDEDFERLLRKAASTPRSELETQLWRQRTSWKNVALETVQAYCQAVRTTTRGTTR